MNQSHPVFIRTRPIVQLKQIIQENKEFLIQPIIDLQTSQRVETAVNHDGGLVTCITSFANIDKVQQIFCQGCKQIISTSLYYYDFTLDKILKQMKKNYQAYEGVQTVKFFRTGEWEVLAQSFEEATCFELLQNHPIIQQLSRAGEIIINDYFQHQTLDKINEVQIDSICSKISMAEKIWSDFEPALVSRANYTRSLEYLEILFLKTFKVLQFRIALKPNNLIFQDGDLKRFQGLPCPGIFKSFKEDSRIYQHSLDKIFIFGEIVQKNELEQFTGMESVFHGSFQDFIDNYSSKQMSADDQILRFQKLPIKFCEKRHGFHLIVYNEYLYVVGGWRRCDRKTLDKKELKSQSEIMTDARQYNLYDDLVTISVKSIERIKLNELLNNEGSFERYGQFDRNLKGFSCNLINGKLVFAGGSQLIYTENQINYQPFVGIMIFHLESKQCQIMNINLLNINFMDPMTSININDTEFLLFGGWEMDVTQKQKAQISNLYIISNDGFQLLKTIPIYNEKELNAVIFQYDLLNPNVSKQIIQRVSQRFSNKFKFIMRNHWSNEESIKKNQIGTFRLYGIDDQYNIHNLY